MLAIVPAGGATSSQTVADVWTGTWPAFLMEGGKITDPLGTLKWRQIRYEEGVSMLGKNFGGRVFEGCSTSDPDTLFFRGSYVEGGDLVACTTGADGKTIVGRFNGREDFRSGSFTVSITRDDDKRIFAGKYFEDDGVTTDWCGSLLRTAPAVVPRLAAPDVVAPRVQALASSGRAGTAVKLRFRLSERASVQVVVRRGTRIVGRSTLTARAGLVFGTWRVPKGLTGALRFTVVAVDPAGNSGSSSAALRLT